jgi:hypothetical protein
MADDPIRAGRKRRRVTPKDRGPSSPKSAAHDLFPERSPIKARFTHVIAQVASAVAHSFPLARIVETVLEQSVQTIGASVAYVMLADEKRRELRLVGHRNLPEDFAGTLSSVSFDAPLLTARGVDREGPGPVRRGYRAVGADTDARTSVEDGLLRDADRDSSHRARPPRRRASARTVRASRVHG